MTVKFTNNASTTVGTGINASATSLTVASASSFPSLSGADDYCYLTIQGATSTTREVVKATALSGNTFTIVRAQDNTSAGTWSAGDIVELRMTAALLTDVIDAATVEGVKTNFQYTPTAGQTVFSGADNASNTLIINQAALVSVYMNGVRLVQGTDYSVSSANNTVTLTVGATTADIIDIEVFGNFTGQSGAAVAITGGAISGTSVAATTLSASGTATLNTFVSNNSTISGGTINGVNIGATTAGTGRFSTLTTTGNILVNGNHHVVGSSGSATNSLKASYNSTSGVATFGPDSNGGNTSLNIGTSNSGTFATALTLANTGNATFSGSVGVGISSPQAKLHSYTSGTGSIPTGQFNQTADDNTALALINANNSAAYSAIKLETRETQAAGWMIANEWQSAFNGDLVFRGRDGGTTSAEVLRLKSNGSVGIGVDNGDVTGDGNSNRTYVGIIGSGNRGRLNLGSTASNGADAGTLAFTNGANVLADISVDTTSGVQNTGTVYVNGTRSIKIQAAAGDEVVFNEGHRDTDFRVESDTVPHMLFVEASTNRVGIGNDDPNRLLSLKHASQAEIGFKTGSVSNGALIYYNDSENKLLLRAQETTDRIEFQTGGTTPKMTLGSDGNLLVGTTQTGGVRLNSETNLNGNLAGQFRNTHATGSYGIKVMGGHDSSNYSAVFTDKDNNTLMMIRGNGNTGIGAAPDTTGYGGTFKYLGVNGGSGYGIFNGQTTSTTGAAASFFGSTTGTSGYQLLGGMQVVNGANSSSNAEGDLVFYTATGGSLGERMRIRRDGEVDIKLNANAFGTFSDNIGEVGAGNFCLQIANSAGSALKPLGFRAEEIKFATGSATRMTIDSAGATTFAGNVKATDIIAKDSGGLTFQTDEGSKRLTIQDNGTLRFFTGVSYSDMYMYTQTNVIGNGQITMQPVTTPGSGTADQYLHLASTAASGARTRMNLRVDGFLQCGSNVDSAYALQISNGTYTWLVGTSGNTLNFYGASGTRYGHVSTSNGGTFVNGSDRAFKENIVDLEYGLKEVKEIQSRRYDIKETGDTAIGFIAQELKEVVPEVVEGEEGSMGVAYANLVPVLVKAIQEQQDLIESLTARVAELENN